MKISDLFIHCGNVKLDTKFEVDIYNFAKRPIESLEPMYYHDLPLDIRNDMDIINFEMEKDGRMYVLLKPTP